MKKETNSNGEDLKNTGLSVDKSQVGGKHYKEDKIQHWNVMLANGFPYMEGQIIKYVWRWRRKNGIEDLRKARHFLEKLIDYEMTEGADSANAAGEEPGPGYVDQG